MRAYTWRIVRRGDDRVEEQIQHVVDRLEPIRDALVELTADPGITARLTVDEYDQFCKPLRRGNPSVDVSGSRSPGISSSTPCEQIAVFEGPQRGA